MKLPFVYLAGCLVCFLFLVRVVSVPGFPGTHSVYQAGPELSFSGTLAHLHANKVNTFLNTGILTFFTYNLGQNFLSSEEDC
jgi:hypothetical protein